MSDADKASPVQGDVTRICGNCRHWSQAKPYAWGNCNSPLPEWAVISECSESSPVVGTDCDWAKDCEMFDPYNAGIQPSERSEDRLE
jgi:hypothetical protein